MLDHLMESGRTRYGTGAGQRGGRGLLASVVVHAVIIGAMVQATARATAARSRPSIAAVPVRFVVQPVPSMPREPGAAGGTGAGRRSRLPEAPRVPPVGLPPVGAPPVTDWNALLATSRDIGSAAGQSTAPAGDGAGAGAIADAADVALRPFPTNPAPVYPPALRLAGIEGRVEARFVVDTTGRVDPASVVFADRVADAFHEAVARALERARFAPPRAHGRPVRVLVDQAFEFHIER